MCTIADASETAICHDSIVAAPILSDPACLMGAPHAALHDDVPMSSALARGNCVLRIKIA